MASNDGPSYGQFGDCRLYGHAWFAVPSDWTPALGGTPMTLRCERCGMERRDSVGTNTGELVARHYYAPEGYYYTRDEYHPTRDEFRLMWIHQHIREARERRRPARKRTGSKEQQSA